MAETRAEPDTSTSATTTQTTAKKATATQATTKKATAKKATSTTKKTTKKATSKATKAASTTTTQTPPLLEREPQVLLEDVGYAAAGVAHDAVGIARELPDRVETTVKDVRARISTDLQGWLNSFEQHLDGKAADGRKVTESWRSDERVKRILDQTDSTRSQVKGAITSVVRTGTAAAKAGREQADTATSRVKAAATSTRTSAETVAEAVSEETTTDH